MRQDPVENQVAILVVDDNESTRYLLSRTLKQAGYKVLEASYGHEALELVQTQRPDLVTLDVNLPDMSGIEICRRIKESSELRSIPIIHISATYVQTLDKVKALNSGADGYLTHPVEDLVLIATVRAFLRARRAEKERELLLKQSRTDLENLQAEKDLREKFVATLTHDLRTPMTAIKMNAQLLLRLPEVSESIQPYLNKIKDNIDRADNMIRDLLDANRLRAGEKLPIDIRECELTKVIKDTIENLSSSHGDRFFLKAKNRVYGTLDCGAVQRALENLMGNAVKYGAPQKPITITLTEDEEKIAIAVHNEGKPIDFDEKSDLFKPYRRSSSAQKSSQKGWGLGLTVVSGVVEAHGGKVSVESSESRGTVFTMTLPRTVAF